VTQAARRRRTALGLAAAFLATFLFAVGTANAVTASVTILPGPVGFLSAPSSVSFPSSAAGSEARTVSASQAFNVGAAGSLSGWSISATSTTFSSGTHALPNAATTIFSPPPEPQCDARSTCTVGVAPTVSYPYVLPAGAKQPTATKLFAAVPGTGIGNETFTPRWTLNLPRDLHAGNYRSTWTISLTTGP
jgi:hypothetical protein